MAGRRIFSQGSEIIPSWPASPPLSAILNFPGLKKQPPFRQRTDVLARIVGQQMRATIDLFLTTHPTATLTLLIATSHGNPGPLSEIADAHCTGGEMSMIDSSTWKGIVTDNLITEINAGLKRELPGITMSAACASSLVAISYASDRINANLCDAVLVVAIDTLSRVATVGFNNIGAMSQQGCRPYDRFRDGTTVGEGAVAIFLSKENLLPEQDIYGLVTGTSVFCDAAHMVEPSSNGIATVIQNALEQAQLQPSDVHGIFWHGTGTRQNDKAEASAAQIVFGNKSPLSTSTKGSLGHTMGASGGFNVLAACESIRQKILPHIASTQDSEFDNLHLALNTPHPITSGPILVTALGFGGINAAITISPSKGFQ